MNLNVLDVAEKRVKSRFSFRQASQSVRGIRRQKTYLREAGGHARTEIGRGVDIQAYSRTVGRGKRERYIAVERKARNHSSRHFVKGKSGG